MGGQATFETSDPKTTTTLSNRVSIHIHTLDSEAFSLCLRVHLCHNGMNSRASRKLRKFRSCQRRETSFSSVEFDSAAAVAPASIGQNRKLIHSLDSLSSLALFIGPTFDFCCKRNLNLQLRFQVQRGQLRPAPVSATLRKKSSLPTLRFYEIAFAAFDFDYIKDSRATF